MIIVCWRVYLPSLRRTCVQVYATSHACMYVVWMPTHARNYMYNAYGYRAISSLRIIQVMPRDTHIGYHFVSSDQEMPNPNRRQGPTACIFVTRCSTCCYVLCVVYTVYVFCVILCDVYELQGGNVIWRAGEGEPVCTLRRTCLTCNEAAFVVLTIARRDSGGWQWPTVHAPYGGSVLARFTQGA